MNRFALIPMFLVLAGPARAEPAKIGGMPEAQAKAWWAFQPLPAAASLQSPASIDGFIDRALSAKGLKPNPPADRRTLIRRLSYGLTGLPPTAEEVDAFVNDKSPDAYERLVERLLASPQYGAHWGRHWLDVVRYADTAGENTDRPLPHAWRYRNWVIDAFNRDLPYDRFVQLQLAGDLLGAAGSETEFREGIIATGYLAIARRFGHDIDEDIHLMYEDVIDNLGKTFLGLTTACARCHDHKYDPVTARDYYALYGIFSSSRFSFSGCEKTGQPRDLVPLMSPEQVERLTKLQRDRKAASDAGRARAKELAAQATRELAAAQVGEGASVPFEQKLTVRKGEVIQLVVSPNASHGADSTLVEWTIRNDQHAWSVGDLIGTFTSSNPHPAAAGAAWYFLEATDGPVLLVDKQEALQGRSELKKWAAGDLPSVFVNTADQAVKVWTALPARSVFVHPGIKRPVAVAWVSPVDGPVSLSGRVADAHPSGGDGVAFILQHLASPEFGSVLAKLGGAGKPASQNEAQPVIPVAYAVVEGKVAHARLQVKGDPEQPGDEVPRRWLGILGGDEVPAGQGSGRRQLGDWIAGHPLAARVMVNRVWQGHFGQGLVRTPNDFGARGERPTHPELLDDLAATFVAGGYRIKDLHRLILHSAAYQRGSACSESLHEADPGNRLLARFERRRLSAEELRDSLLQISGALDPEPGTAHPFPPEAGWKFTQHDPFTAVYPTTRRSVFVMVQRQREHPFLALFDGADPNASTAGRETSTVPTQALFFLNDPFFHEQARRFGEGLISAAETDPARLERACRSVYQRPPSVREREAAARFLASYAGTPVEKWSAYARSLLASNEFLHLD